MTQSMFTALCLANSQTREAFGEPTISVKATPLLPCGKKYT